MDSKEKQELKEKYKGIPDNVLVDMLREGKEAYRESAYEILCGEALRRGIENKVSSQEKAKDGDRIEDSPSGNSKEARPDVFVEIIIINNDKDMEPVLAILDKADLAYNVEGLSLKESSLPVALAVQEAKVEEAVRLLKGFKPLGSMVLW